MWYNSDLLTEEEAVQPKAGIMSISLPYHDTTGAKDLQYSELLNKRGLDDIEWDGKRVLLRTDYNVSINNGYVEDASRIHHSLPTLKRLLEGSGQPNGGAKCVVIISHLGRPAGNYKREDFTLAPVAQYLRQCLRPKFPVEFLSDCVGADIVARTHNCRHGTVFLCENLRCHVEEIGATINAEGKEVHATPEAVRAFCAELGKLGDIFVNDAYACAHRPHTSVVLNSIALRVAGLCMQRELHAYARLLTPRTLDERTGKRTGPEAPFVAVVGSAMRVKDKARLLLNLLDRVDVLMITGGMAFTFKAILDPSVAVGTALIDVTAVRDVEKILRVAREKGVEIHLPDDHMIAASMDPDAPVGSCTDESGAPEGWLPLDIGPRSRARISEVLGTARTVLWVGTVGCYEWAPFSAGTGGLLTDMVSAVKRGATAVVCGGDASTAARRFFVGDRPAAEQLSHVSSGGGSSLVLLEGKMLHGAAKLTCL